MMILVAVKVGLDLWTEWPALLSKTTREAAPSQSQSAR